MSQYKRKINKKLNIFTKSIYLYIYSRFIIRFFSPFVILSCVCDKVFLGNVFAYRNCHFKVSLIMKYNKM